MNEITHVIHLAAQVSVPVSVEKPVESGSINVAGFMNVLDSARRHNVAKFVYASSAAVYGVPMILPLTEKSNTVPISPYGLEKLINDQYANLYNSLYGISSIGMRYFNVYGDRQDPASSYSGVISRFIDAAVKGKVITVYGDGLQTRDFIHVSDIAKVNFAALQSSAIGVLNVATGSSVTLLELVSSIEDSLGRKLQIKFSEAREGDIKKSITDTANLQSMLKIGEMTTISQGLKQLIAPAIVDLRKS
jgi:UDP-glucose 4-epimerase